MNSTELLSSLPEPVTEEARRLRSLVSPRRWRTIVEDALEKARIVREVFDLHEQAGEQRLPSLKKIAPEVGWSCFEHWRRRWQSGDGPAWERLLDRRVPPRPEKTPSDVSAAAVILRHADPKMNREKARKHLVKQFGEKGELSDTTIQRLWSAAGLTHPGNGDAGRFEKVERFHGGGGLALIAAAALETGIMNALARAALKAARDHASAQDKPVAVREPEGRDERGRFTGEYNHSVRADVDPGEPDPRWDTDARKRERCDLESLELLGMKPETLAQHGLAFGVTPLVTECRGFDGLIVPRANWIGAMGQPSYQASTLDKTLEELALLNTGEALWGEHGQQWAKKAWEWGGKESCPRLFALYIDATQEPYWTWRYAQSGKVSRTGRVMPCLSRIALMGGPGCPLVVETVPGTVSLKKAFLDTLRSAEAIVGCGEIGRVTIMDAESATAEVMTALAGDPKAPNRYFITVLKGPGAKSVKLENGTDWEPYRERDRIRSGIVVIKGKGAPEGGLKLYAVEMEREGSRHPKRTLFPTNAPVPDVLAPAEVADLYLSRWPHQEQMFRVTRNGAGMNHTHGYGGEYVTHVALETKLEKAERGVARAGKRLAELEEKKSEAGSLIKCAQTDTQKKAAHQAVKRLEDEKKKAEKVLKKAREEFHDLDTTPREIYKRDTTRENIVTVFTLSVLMLIEFILRDYFGGQRMQMRTFIQHFVDAPTTVRTSRYRILYQIEANPKAPKRTEQLRRACAEVTRRNLRKDGRLLVFEVVESPDNFL